VNHAQRRVDGSSDVVVGLARVGGIEALHQLEPTKRDEANSPDHEYAMDYGKQGAIPS
jgi:hypothetical protein